MNKLIKSLALVGVLTVVGATRTQADSGTISPANSTVLCGGSTNLTITGRTVGGIQWHKSIDGGGTFTALTNTAATLNTGPLNQTTLYRVWTAGGGNSLNDGIVNVNAGGVATATPSAVCSGGTTTLSLVDHCGAIQWYISTDGGVGFNPISGATYAPFTTGPLYPGTYHPIFRCYNGWDSTSPTVTVTPAPVGGTATPTASTVCSGGSTTITLTGYSGTTIQWYSTPDGSPGSFTPIGGNSPTVNTGPLTQTTYFRAQVGTASPCSLADSTTPGVTVNALPAAPTAGNNGPVCAGSTLSLTASIVAGATYAWTGPNSFTSADQNPTIPTATTAATGTYSVTTTVAGCTSAAGTTAATVNPLPTAGVNSATICVGGSATLTATSDASSPGYLWSPGAETTASITVSPTSTTTYTVTVTDGTTSCANSGSGIVTVNPQPTAGVNSATICVGGSATLTATSDASSPGYLWSPGAETTASITVSPTSTTTYTVTVTDGTTSCANSGSGTVTVNPLPTVSVNSETISPGGSATLTATTGAGSPGYLWSPGAETTASITVSPTSTTTYTVTVTDGTTSCANSGSGTVTVTASSLASVTISNIIGTTLTYGGGSGLQFVLLKSASVVAPLSGWDRLLTNTATPGTFTIPAVGTGAPVFYDIKSE